MLTRPSPPAVALALALSAAWAAAAAPPPPDLATASRPAPAAPAWMHSPHDVIDGWAISPDFERDRTLILFMSRFSLLLRSRDAGSSFEAIGAGLDSSLVTCLAISPDFARDSTLWCVEARGLFTSRDAGDFWVRIPTPPGLRQAVTLAASPDFARDGTLLAGTLIDGLWISRDRGASWEQLPLPAPDRAGGAPPVSPLALSPDYAHDGTIVARFGGNRLVLSADGGRTFERIGGPPAPVQALIVGEAFSRRGRLWAGTRDAGVWRSDDRGATWQPDGEELGAENVLHVARVVGREGGVMFAATAADGVFVRPDGGRWTASTTGLREQTRQTREHYRGAIPSPAFTRDRTLFAASFEGLHVSRDGGTTWQWLNVLQPRLIRNLALSPRFALDHRLWLSTYGGGLQLSEDGGATFRRLQTREWMFPDAIAVSPSYDEDRTLLVGLPNRLMLSRDACGTLEDMVPGSRGFARFATFAPDWRLSGIAFACFNNVDDDKARFVRTVDRGRSWTDGNVANPHDMAFATDWRTSGRAFAATPTGLFRTDDRGQNFSRVESLDALGVSSVSLAPGPRGDILMVCSEAQGVHLSSDGGATWTLLALSVPPVKPNRVGLSPGFARDGTAFAGPANDRLFVTRNGGRTWARAVDGPRVVLALGLSPTFEADRTVVVGSYDGAWLSRDAGATWTHIMTNVPDVPVITHESRTPGADDSVVDPFIDESSPH